MLRVETVQSLVIPRENYSLPIEPEVLAAFELGASQDPGLALLEVRGMYEPGTPDPWRWNVRISDRRDGQEPLLGQLAVHQPNHLITSTVKPREAIEATLDWIRQSGAVSWMPGIVVETELPLVFSGLVLARGV